MSDRELSAAISHMYRNSQFGAYGQNGNGMVNNIFDALSKEEPYVQRKYVFNIDEVISVLDTRFSEFGNVVLETMDTTYLAYQHIAYTVGCDTVDGASIYDAMIDVGMPTDIASAIRDILHDTIVSMIWSVLPSNYERVVDIAMSGNDMIITINEPNPILMMIEEQLQRNEGEVELIESTYDKSMDVGVHPTISLMYEPFT